MWMTHELQMRAFHRRHLKFSDIVPDTITIFKHNLKNDKNLITTNTVPLSLVHTTEKLLHRRSQLCRLRRNLRAGAASAMLGFESETAVQGFHNRVKYPHFRVTGMLLGLQGRVIQKRPETRVIDSSQIYFISALPISPIFRSVLNQLLYI